MQSGKSEIRKREVLRLSNEASNRVTRECIASALILLMAETEYPRITISEITKRAGVSRTAYYRNYACKEDILKDLLQTTIADMHAAMDRYSYINESKKYWRELFCVTRTHAGAFTTLLKAGFGHTILDEITRHMTRNIPEDYQKQRYDMIFWSGAVYNLLIHWLESGMQQHEDDMAENCLYIMDHLHS